MLTSSNRHDKFHINADEAEKFVQSALDAMADHTAILDDDGNIIGVNKAWRTFANDNGFTDTNYGIGTNYLSVCKASARQRSEYAVKVLDGIQSVMRAKSEDFQMEYPCHSPTEKRWFVVRISRFNWYDQHRIVVAHQNVTELKQAQIEVAESNQRLEAIVDNINNGILTITPHGFVKTANQATARIFGYEPDEILGLHLDQLTVEMIDRPVALYALVGEHGHETIGIRKDGSHFPMYFSLNKLRLDDGTIYTCIIQDITSLRRMEAEILEREHVERALYRERELRSLKNRFLSMMGHELNTPLASISLSYDMLKKYGDVSTPEENEQALDNIHQQVNHLRDMVKDVMTLSRSDQGIDVQKEMSNIVTYCQDIVEEFHFTYSRTHSIEFESNETDIRLPIDRRLLRRAFTNLLSNAIKYSPKGGVVSLKMQCDRSRENLVIQIVDSGIGIPQEDYARLFEPFHRAANTDKLPGTGLGLAIVKQAIEVHGGTIDFESKVGNGTTFTIILPLS